MCGKTFEVYCVDLVSHLKSHLTVSAPDVNEAKRNVFKLHPTFIIELIYPKELVPL